MTELVMVLCCTLFFLMCAAALCWVVIGSLVLFGNKKHWHDYLTGPILIAAGLSFWVGLGFRIYVSWISWPGYYSSLKNPYWAFTYANEKACENGLFECRYYGGSYSVGTQAVGGARATWVTVPRKTVAEGKGTVTTAKVVTNDSS